MGAEDRYTREDLMLLDTMLEDGQAVVMTRPMYEAQNDAVACTVSFRKAFLCQDNFSSKSLCEALRAPITEQHFVYGPFLRLMHILMYGLDLDQIPLYINKYELPEEFAHKTVIEWRLKIGR